MLTRLKNSFTTAKKWVTSPQSSLIEMNINKAAGMGGSLLSFFTFFPATFTNYAQLITTSLVSPVTFIILNINDYFKIQRVDKAQIQLANNKLLVGAVIEELINEEMKQQLVQKQQLTSYEDLLPTLQASASKKQQALGVSSQEKEKINFDAALDIKLETMINTFLKSESNTDIFLKTSSNFINYSFSFIISCSAIAIHFIVPMVLEKEFDNKNINYPAMAFSLLFAIYATFSAYAQTDKMYADLDLKKENLKKSISMLCELYEKRCHANSLHAPAFLQIWQRSKDTIIDVNHLLDPGLVSSDDYNKINGRENSQEVYIPMRLV